MRHADPGNFDGQAGDAGRGAQQRQALHRAAVPAPRKRLVRYLLSELEVGFGGQRIDFDASEATVEHILPENAASGWDSFSHEDRQRDVRRLGNLTPLEYRLNKGVGNAEFGRKREAYAQSAYHLTTSIDQAEWTPAAVRARQARMADLAITIWRIEDVEA